MRANCASICDQASRNERRCKWESGNSKRERAERSRNERSEQNGRDEQDERKEQAMRKMKGSDGAFRDEINAEIKAEIKRKSFHLLGGLSFSIICFFVPDRFHAVFIEVFACFIVFLLLIEWMRMRGVVKLPMLREYEKSGRIGGYVFFFVGAFVCFLLFPKEIAVASVLMLSTGDAVSGVVFRIVRSGAKERGKGFICVKRVGRVKPFSVILSMFLTSFTAGFMFFCMINHHLSLVLALSGAIGATIADSFYMKISNFYLDDNLTIPIFASCAMLIALWGFAAFL